MGEDVTRFGVYREDVDDNFIVARSFLAIFDGCEELVSQGAGKRELVDKVLNARYAGLSHEERSVKLQEDIARAQRGEAIYCPCVRKLLFPD